MINNKNDTDSNRFGIGIFIGFGLKVKQALQHKFWLVKRLFRFMFLNLGSIVELGGT